jgi:uncharacterized protein YbaP (TraB family)
MKIISTAFIATFFCFFFSVAFAQPTSSKTLLWRISGNGLEKPSYLYGTMHLKDRRLFFFGDSVYKSIETSKGFAMELDPNEMMDSVFAKMSEGDTTSLLKKMLDEKKFKSIEKKLEKKFGMPAGKITRKQLIDDRNSQYYNKRKSDDMQSVVDMYLYNIAHRQGKWVGGIEDVNDQFGIKDELGKDVNITDYVDDDNSAKRDDYLEKMIALYTDQDIDKFDALFSDPAFQKTKDMLLVHRNIKMARRMDSLAHIRNSFFAVGAAHLPGEDGLIKLLSAKGFSVTPVFSSKKMAPENYTYNANKIPWIKFAGKDSAYTAEMPGKPGDLDAVVGEMKFKVYADLVTNIFFMTGWTFYGTDENQEAVMDRIMKSFAAKGMEKQSEKKISNHGVNGNEIIAVVQKAYYRIQVYTAANKIYMVMAGSSKKSDLFDSDIEKFMSGFTMNTTVTPKSNVWVNHTDSLKAFFVSFPKKPSIDKLKNNNETKNIATTTVTALDIPNNTYYMVIVNDADKGFLMNADSAIFEDKLNYYKSIKSTVTDIRKFDYEGNAAMSFVALSKLEGLDYISKLLVVCRGNRTYTIAAIAQKGKEDYPDITRFFRSFKLNTFKQPVWSKVESIGNSFTTWAPEAFGRPLQDTTGLSADEKEASLKEAKVNVQLIAQDIYAVTDFNINIHAASKYYYAKNDSTFLADELATYFADTSSATAKARPGHFDSLLSKKTTTNGTVNGYEILVKNPAKSYFKRVRILPHGDSSYHLFVLGSYDYITSENSNHFFSDFRFRDESLPSAVSKNKAAILLNDLASSDSATRVGARAYLNDYNFSTTDLPLLYGAYLKKYPADADEYRTINEKISDVITKLKDSATVSFVKDNYISATTGQPELKIEMLKMLAKQQTTSATNILKDLLLKAPPVKGNAGPLIYSIRDSMLLANILFPEASRFFGDSILGPGTIRLASELIDSNLLRKEIFTDNKIGVLQTAKAQLNAMKKGNYATYNNYVIDALQKINDQSAIGLLNGFVKTADLDAKQNALLAMLKLKQTVSPLEIRKLAADKGYRTYFYKELKAIGRQELFTPEFLSQQQFADAYMYNFASDEDADNTVSKFLSEKTAVIKGVQKRFYLFKVSFSYDDEPESHLAICGPFDLDRKSIVINEDGMAQKIFYEEKFSSAAIGGLFNKYILEENQKATTPPVK